MTDARAVVTGGSSGIGAATAVALAQNGFDVGITFRTDSAGAQRVQDEVRQIGRRAVAIRADFADPDEAYRVVDDLTRRLGGIEVLVNNAGTNPRATVLKETRGGFERTLAINLISAWASARAAAKHMIDAGRGGRIINVTSVLAVAPLEGAGAYCASKSALEALTKVMALELAPHHITVNAVSPGHIATPMNYAQDEEASAAMAFRPVIPAGRAGAAAEVACGIAYLASPQAGYTTGACLLIDGGLLIASGPRTLQQQTALPASARREHQ